uniref:Uncharacterized protein n=1 Tax=Tetraselmis sp. GSL018 TaxID=582737 RepID=A0A061RDM1_9CHLO
MSLVYVRAIHPCGSVLEFPTPAGRLAAHLFGEFFIFLPVLDYNYRPEETTLDVIHHKRIDTTQVPVASRFNLGEYVQWQLNSFPFGLRWVPCWRFGSRSGSCGLRATGLYGVWQ